MSIAMQYMMIARAIPVYSRYSTQILHNMFRGRDACTQPHNRW